MRRTLLLAPLLAMASGFQTEAGTFYECHYACVGGHNEYYLAWDGPWVDPQIYIAKKHDWSEEFYFWAGYLQEQGQIYSVPTDSWYMMMGCTGQVCEPLGTAVVPYISPCDPLD
jgi:hypothetical protein